MLFRSSEKFRRQYARLNNLQLCEALLPLLDKGLDRGDHRVIAQSVGMTEGALRTAWHRFKASFATTFRELVAETVSDPSDVDAELRHLLAAWLSTSK